MPNLTWYVNRLRAMSAAEVGYRLRHSAQTWVDRARLAGGRLPGAVLPEPLEPLPTPFFFDPNRAEEMREVWAREYPDGLTRLRAEAEDLLAGRAIVFDREITWTDTPDWHADVVGGGAWPRRFWSTVQYRDGGAKYVWELARHQHLMTLTRAACLTGETRYADAAVRWLKSWIDENPPYIGIHWISALEMGLRLIAWSWIYRFLAPYPLPPDLEREFFRQVQLQAEFIRRYHSEHSSANNHLIGEAAGVAMAGLAFPWLAKAAEWRDWGLSMLARELSRQCHPDGVSAEQTFHYQAFVMDLALQPVLLAQHGGGTPSSGSNTLLGATTAPAGEPFLTPQRRRLRGDPTRLAHETPVEILERLEAMAGFLYTAMDSSGALPNVGDADDGAAILLGQDPQHSFRSLLATCGVLFNRAEFCRAAGTLDEKSAWLLGPAGRDRFEALRTAGGQSQGAEKEQFAIANSQLQICNYPQPPVPASQSFTDGGYTLMRSGAGAQEQLLLLDHGPLGYLSLAAHGHADCLSLVLHLGGRPVLVDPGTFTYHEDPVWRQYFRGTTAHNTVTVDREHQSLQTGPTMWGRRAQAQKHRWVTQPAFDFVEAEHDGYQRLPGRPRHQRSVFHRRGGATFVVDRVLGGGAHEAELTWHLPEGCALEAMDSLGPGRGDSGGRLTGAGTRPAPTGWLARGDGFELQLAVVADTTPDTEIVEGRTDPPQGWVSPRFGVRVPAPVLCSRVRAPLPVSWVTVLLPRLVAPGETSQEGSPRRRRFCAEEGVRPAAGALRASHDSQPSAITGRVDARAAVVTVTRPGGQEIYAQLYDPESEIELDRGRFRGCAAHLRVDGAGRLVEFCVIGGLELEWEGQVVWRSQGDRSDAYVVLPSEVTEVSHVVLGQLTSV